MVAIAAIDLRRGPVGHQGGGCSSTRYLTPGEQAKLILFGVTAGCYRGSARCSPEVLRRFDRWMLGA